MKQVVRELFGPWSGSPRAALPPVPPVQPAKGPSWLAAVDDDASQVSITIGYTTRSDAVVDRAAQMVLREMLEDDVRIVREGMGASYGIHVSQLAAAAGGALVVSGDVDQAQAGEALRRILASLATLRGDAPAARAAFVRARRKALALALARRGGAATVSAQLADLAAQGLPPDRASDVARQIAALTPAHLGKVAAADLDETRLVVVVRGPKAAVEATYAALQITPEWPGRK
jgi:zinc protease